MLRNKWELLLQTSLGNSLQATKGWSTDSVKHAYTRALQLCKESGRANLTNIPFLRCLACGPGISFIHRLVKLKPLPNNLLNIAENVDQLGS